MIFGPAFAETPSPNWISLEAGFGYESQSSPLFKVSPESAVIYLGGLQRLRGSNLRTSAQGFAEQSLDNGMSVSVSGDATLKHSPSTPDLDFSAYSVQPNVYLPLPGSSIGVGLNFQHMNVAGAHFRDTRSLQASWTNFDDKNLWAVVADAGKNLHQGELTDLDSNTTSMVLKRQINAPVDFIDVFDMSMIFGKQINQRGLPYLSYRSAMIHASAKWSMLGLNWSLGKAWLKARFEDSSFPNEAARKDTTGMFDLMAEWDFNQRQSVRIEFNDVRNNSNIVLYGNHYQQVSVIFRIVL